MAEDQERKKVDERLRGASIIRMQIDQREKERLREQVSHLSLRRIAPAMNALQLLSHTGVPAQHEFNDAPCLTEASLGIEPPLGQKRSLSGRLVRHPDEGGAQAWSFCRVLRGGGFLQARYHCTPPPGGGGSYNHYPLGGYKCVRPPDEQEPLLLSNLSVKPVTNFSLKPVAYYCINPLTNFVFPAGAAGNGAPSGRRDLSWQVGGLIPGSPWVG